MLGGKHGQDRHSWFTTEGEVGKIGEHRYTIDTPCPKHGHNLLYAGGEFRRLAKVHCPKLVNTFWLIVIFGEIERSRGSRGIIKDYAH
jgi:hypothetical protein